MLERARYQLAFRGRKIDQIKLFFHSIVSSFFFLEIDDNYSVDEVLDNLDEDFDSFDRLKLIFLNISI